jgi:glycosidase
MDAEDFDYEVRNLLEMQKNHSPYQLNLLAGHDTARIRTLCKDNIDRQIIALVFIFTFIGAPLIYYGDEIGMEGGDDPDCRRPMIWDENRWNERLNDIYRLLINTRKKYKSLRYGEFTPLLVFNGIYVYKRCFEDEEIIIVLNPREERKNISIPLQSDLGGSTWIDIMSDKEVKDSQGFLKLAKVPSQSTHIFIKKASGK